jgi:hypothetical protein
MNEYFIGISVSELQQWLCDDELPVSIDRINHSRTQPDPKLSGHKLESLFKSLPAFSLDDPAGVLIVEVAGPTTWKADDAPSIRHLVLSEVKKFIPLTEDAKGALAVNWSGVIKLSAAVFEREYTHFRISRKSISACRAGNLFANLFICHGPNGFTASGLFSDTLPRALMAAEHRRLDEIEAVFGNGIDRLPETWVERAFGDTRSRKDNQPLNLKGVPFNLGSIVTLGALLSKVDAVNDLTDCVRTIYERLKAANGHDLPLVAVYADSELSRLKASFNVDATCTASISLVTLALFLRWKLAFHVQRSSVNALSILNDVRSLAGFVDVELVANALWMMGAYLGMEHIAPTYRHLHQEKYSALQFAGKEKNFEPVHAWQLQESNRPAEDESAHDSVQGFEAARMPKHESALDKHSETDKERQEKGDVPEARQTGSSQEDNPDGTEQSTDISGPGEPSSARDTSISPKDTQAQQAQQVSQADSAVSEPPEQRTEIAVTSSVAEVSIFEDANTSAASSDQGVKKMRKAAASVPLKSEDKKAASSSSRNSPNTGTAKPGTSTRKRVDTPPKAPATSSKEGISSVDPVQIEGSLKEREEKNESGKAVQNDFPFH